MELGIVGAIPDRQVAANAIGTTRRVVATAVSAGVKTVAVLHRLFTFPDEGPASLSGQMAGYPGLGQAEAPEISSVAFKAFAEGNAKHPQATFGRYAIRGLSPTSTIYMHG